MDETQIFHTKIKTDNFHKRARLKTTMLRPPKLIKPYVISFCRGVVQDPHPLYLRVEVAIGTEPDSCFITVPKHVVANGGKQQIGWAIWEWPGVMIEAEFHAIWISPSGDSLDITPKRVPVPRILFLPDSQRAYHGRQIDNIRKPLRPDRDLNRFFELSRLIFQETNKGDLAYQHGQIPLSPIGYKYIAEKQQIQDVLFHRYGAPVLEAES